MVPLGTPSPPACAGKSIREYLGGRTWLTFTLILCYIPFFVQAYPHKRLPRHNDIRQLSTSAQESSSWIWTSGPTTGNVAFLKTFTSATGKTAATATIGMTAVNKFTLWVNGQPIGRVSGDGANDWESVQVLTAGLNASTNTFSVLAVNNGNSSAPAPGLLAAIQVHYSDGSSDTVVSDSSWGVSAVIPSDFPTPSDTSNFTTATVVAELGESNVTISSAASPPSLSTSTWIWSISKAASDAPVGTVGFRRTVVTPSGKSAQSATILLTCDNFFSLYVNNAYVGSPPGVPLLPNISQAEQFTVDLAAVSNTFTVFGSNIPSPGSTDAGPAGLIAAITIQFSDGSSELVATDASWLTGAFTTVSAFLSTADAALSPAFELGVLGAKPYGQLSGISNALAASDVPSAPFTNGTLPQTSSNGSNKKASVPIGAIVGAVVAVLALIALGLAAFWWRRRRGSRDSQAPSKPLPVPPTQHSELGASSVISGSWRTSAVSSSRPPDMAWMQPQRATGYGYSQPPAVVVLDAAAYPYAAHGSGMPPDGPLGMIPPTKLDRENMIWRNNAAAASSVSNGSRPSVNAVSVSRDQAHRGTAEAGGLETHTLGPETLAPPSYSMM
ncbi:hypothetical protein C8R44DRAFT_294513 [Mycena epipterygia]|nr:hypothetical protein C8R44DRAFT_294513 [Mycena epipterygia]